MSKSKHLEVVFLKGTLHVVIKSPSDFRRHNIISKDIKDLSPIFVQMLCKATVVFDVDGNEISLSELAGVDLKDLKAIGNNLDLVRMIFMDVLDSLRYKVYLNLNKPVFDFESFHIC